MNFGKIAAALAASSLLVACGGGGDGGGGGGGFPVGFVTPAPPPAGQNTSPPAPPASTSPPVVTAPPQVTEPPVVTEPPPTCVVEAPASMTIETTGSAPITSKDLYVTGRLQIAASGTSPAVDATTQIRGRGNSTWELPKKPYRLKIDSKTAVLGMPSDKDWALLANYSDKTLLRNSVAFCLGNMLGMPYVPRQKYAELTLNGQYQGLYQVTEHIKTGDKRVPIGQEDSTIDSGYLLEIDGRATAPDVIFHSSQGMVFEVKTDATAEQLAVIQASINAFESALFGANFADPVNGYAKYIDVDSLVDFYLVNELMRNNDAFNASTYVYKARGGKIVFGPLWDFDIAAGNIYYNGNEAPEGFNLNTTSRYISRVIQDPAFKARVAARWKILSAKMPELQTFIDTSARTLDGAQTKNFQTWDILGILVWPNFQINNTYAGEITYLKNWLSVRARWLDGQYAAWAAP